jgi:hypothetical protein
VRGKTLSNWREWLHAAAVTSGGERSWISAAVSLSTTSQIVLRAIHIVLATFPATRSAQHRSSALSAMPVWQHLPLYHLLGLRQDE